jgi:hypothetical protein
MLAHRVFVVSLKMYLGLRETRAWMAGVAELMPLALPADIDFFVIPDFVSFRAAKAALACISVWPGT